MLKRKKYIKIFFLSFLFLFWCDSKSVLAKQAVEVINFFETGIVDIDITEYQFLEGKEEVWEDNPTVLPGDIISKNPRIYNRGVDCYVRVKVYFNDIKEIDESYLLGINDQWKKADDGYLYYTEVLKSGEEADVFKGLQIPQELSDEMAEKSFSIEIEADAIQSKNFIPDFHSATPWGSIEIEKCEKEGQYDIRTLKKSDKQTFVIEYQDDIGKLIKNADDFFMNFPYLMPGDCYRDFIEISNESDNKDLKIYFRNEVIENSELLEKIILRITTEINGEQKELYEGFLKGAQLSTDDFLGVIPRGAKGKFHFEIEVPGELNNKFTILNSHIKWIFSTKPISEGEDNSAEKDVLTGNPVKTGDASLPVLYVSIIVISGIAVVMVKKRKVRYK